MARIRTIKPEFPHSESMGRVSRDARLLFIMLWTICDDSGRTRGNSRMLSSLLFPYDDDANKHIGTWLKQLESEGCLVRYEVDGQSYIEICNWLSHQKIDRPSPSKFPSFDASSRIIANVREASSLDQGVDQGRDQGKDQGKIQESNVDFFDVAWSAYPKRPGANKTLARKAWDARLKDGASPEEMIDGVYAYANYCQVMATDPQYIKQASTFFGPGEHYKSDWTPTQKVNGNGSKFDIIAETTAKLTGRYRDSSVIDGIAVQVD